MKVPFLPIYLLPGVNFCGERFYYIRAISAHFVNVDLSGSIWLKLCLDPEYRPQLGREGVMAIKAKTQGHFLN